MDIYQQLLNEKKERRNQGRSPNPRKRAQVNSTWPTPPYRGAVQALLHLFKSQRLRFAVFGEAET